MFRNFLREVDKLTHEDIAEIIARREEDAVLGNDKILSKEPCDEAVANAASVRKLDHPDAEEWARKALMDDVDAHEAIRHQLLGGK